MNFFNDVSRVWRAWRAPMTPSNIALIPRDPRDYDDQPLVSVVTVCLNRADSLGRTIASVRAQHYRNIEYIVLDGGSTDRTVDIIRANQDIITDWKSSPDAGLYAALNEGVRRAQGRFVQFVHADDWLAPDQIARAVAAATFVYADIVHGDLEMHRADGSTWLRHGRADWFPLRPAEIPQISHPTVLARRSVYERIGLFRTDLRIAADVDWLLRASHAGLVIRHDPAIRSHMTEGGISTRRQRLALAEYVAILAREPIGRIRLTLGALWLFGTCVAILAPILNGARRFHAAVIRVLSRPRAFVRRATLALLRRTWLVGPVRVLFRETLPVSDRNPMAAAFAKLRFEHADLDDATIAAMAASEVGRRIDSDHAILAPR